jgi:hypothetical protein
MMESRNGVRPPEDSGSLPSGVNSKAVSFELALATETLPEKLPVVKSE